MPQRSQAADSQPTEPEAEDIETIVRQAKETFGDTLPLAYLTEEEYKLYERLYGAPLRETQPSDVGMPFPSIGGEGTGLPAPKNALLRETENGGLVEVEYMPESSEDGMLDGDEDGMLEEIDYPIETSAILEDAAETAREVDGSTVELSKAAQPTYIDVMARNKREYDALIRLQKDFEAASLRALQEEPDVEEQQEGEEEEVDDVEQDEGEEQEDEGPPGVAFSLSERPNSRLHHLSLAGQFKTNPATLNLPAETFVGPISELLRRTDTNHIRQAAKSVFGWPGFPFSAATPQKNLPPEGGLLWEPDSGGCPKSTRMPTCPLSCPGSTRRSCVLSLRYASGSARIGFRGLMSRGDAGGPRVLDAGGAGAGLAAWNDVFEAQWDAWREEGGVSGPHPPEGRRSDKTVLVGSDQLRHRISTFLHNTTFLPRLPDHLHTLGNDQRHIDAAGRPAAKEELRRHHRLSPSHAARQGLQAQGPDGQPLDAAESQRRRAHRPREGPPARL